MLTAQTPIVLKPFHHYFKSRGQEWVACSCLFYRKVIADVLSSNHQNIVREFNALFFFLFFLLFHQWTNLEIIISENILILNQFCSPASAMKQA